jgi:hypothetical protein
VISEDRARSMRRRLSVTAGEDRESSRDPRNATIREMDQLDQVDRQSRIPGYRRVEGAPQLRPQDAANVRDLAVRDVEFRAALADAEDALDELTVAERIMGASGVHRSPAFARAQAAINLIRTQIRRIEEAGNSVAAQSAVEHHIPGLEATTSIASIRNTLREVARQKHNYVTALLQQSGYEPVAGGGHGGGSGGHGGGGHGGGGERGGDGGRHEYRLPNGRVVRGPAGALDQLPDGAEDLGPVGGD